MKSKIPTNLQSKIRNPQSEMLRILILEDVPADAELVERELLRAGIAFMSMWVDTREAFLEQLVDFLPDIVLSDYSMPQFTGMEALELVKERHPSIPVIMVTGSINEDTAVKCLKAGAVDYVIKENLIRLGQAVLGALQKKKLKEQKEKAEKALKKSEHYFRSLLHSLHEDILVIDRDYRITDINNIFLTGCGYRREDVIGRRCHEISHGSNEPCHRHGELCMLGEVFETCEAHECLHEHIHDDGSKVWVDILFSPLKDETGNVTHVIEAMRNVTDLYQKEEALRESEKKYRTILASIEDSYFEVNQRGEITFFNEAFSEIIGYPPDEIMGMKNDKYLDQENRKKVFKKFNEVWKTGIPTKLFEYELIRKNGKKRTVQTSASLVTDENGQKIGFRGVIRDVSDRKQAEEALKKAHDDLERKVVERTEELRIAKEAAETANQAKSDFLASMSHELRTPLNAVIGFSEVLRDKYFGELNEKQADYVNDILESGKHLLSLINDILDLSKVEAGEMELEPSQVNIKDLLENSLVMIKEKAHKHRIGLDIKIPEEMSDLEIQADERKLKQIMFNLLSNAVKFTPDGGKISMTAQSTIINQQSSIQISVADTGIGISPEDHEKIFDEFYQVKGDMKDKTPGTGLGLPLTKRWVEMHGGRIWVESEGEGKGCTFVFVIPDYLTEPRGLKGNKLHSE